jgi:penicillin-binding protein 2
MNRLVRMQAVLWLALAALLIRLADLQLVRGSHYLQLAEQNRLRLVPEQASRGLIRDRHGRLLASNRTMFRVAIVPQELEQYHALLAHVGALIRRRPEDLKREYDLSRSLAFVPAIIASNVPKEAAIRLEEERWRFPGLLVKPETVRAYPLRFHAAHLLGHLSRPTEEELPLLKQYGVRPQHLIGRLGLERLLDPDLRGRPGGVMVEVDHRARQVRVLGRKEPSAGSPASLTIDSPLQSLIEQAFGAQAGAAVVLSPETGEVLAMVSVPSFDPGAFVSGGSDNVERYLNDPAAPLMNRATVGYQPGSIVKLVTAAAGLEAKLITPSTRIVCPGSLTLGDRTFHCWNRDGHGPVTLREAIMQSCNVYFMQLGRRLGAARLRHALEQAGFGRRTGWPLEEQVGHLPSRRLTEGEVALLAIGQGEILLTPLQAAVMAAVFASRGRVVEPWVVRQIGERPAPRRSASPRLAGWAERTLDVVRAGMDAVVRDPNGTGRLAYSPQVAIAGKTGTAQTHLAGRTHGWFVGFCPQQQPVAALAVVAEYGGAGGDLPAAIAKTACEYLAAAAAPVPGEPERAP